MRRRSRIGARGLLAAALVLGVSFVAATAAFGQDGDGQDRVGQGNVGTDSPTVLIVLGSGASAGEELVIAGDGWAPSTPLEARVCGNRGEVLALDCVSLGPAFLSDADGSMVLVTILVNPPAPCPCVVRVRSIEPEAEASLPLEIVGNEPEPPVATDPPVVEPDPVVEPEPVAEEEVVVEEPLVVESVSVTGGGWRSWFALAGERRLEIVVRNPNQTDVGGLTMGFAWGRGPEPENVVDVPLIGGIAAGEAVSLSAPFTVGVPAFGSYEIKGVVGRGLGATAFATSFTTWPWGLFALAAALAVWALRPVVAWARRRRGRVVPRAERPAPRVPELDLVLREALDTHLTGRLDRATGAALGADERSLIAQEVGVEVVCDVLAKIHLTPSQMNALAEHAVAEIMLALETLPADDRPARVAGAPVGGRWGRRT